MSFLPSSTMRKREKEKKKKRKKKRKSKKELPWHSSPRKIGQRERWRSVRCCRCPNIGWHRYSYKHNQEHIPGFLLNKWIFLDHCGTHCESLPLTSKTTISVSELKERLIMSDREAASPTQVQCLLHWCVCRSPHSVSAIQLPHQSHYIFLSCQLLWMQQTCQLLSPSPHPYRCCFAGSSWCVHLYSIMILLHHAQRVVSIVSKYIYIVLRFVIFHLSSMGYSCMPALLHDSCIAMCLSRVHVQIAELKKKKHCTSPSISSILPRPLNNKYAAFPRYHPQPTTHPARIFFVVVFSVVFFVCQRSTQSGRQCLDRIWSQHQPKATKRRWWWTMRQ